MSGHTTGFSIVVPPGWVRIPVGKGSRQAVTAVLDRTFAGIEDPRVAGLRRQLQTAITRQVRAAAAQSGVELYLPVERVHGVTVPASAIVSLPRLEPAEDPADVLLAVVARRPGAEVVEIGGAPAVRTLEHLAGSGAVGVGEEGAPARRQLTYYLAEAGAGARYAVVSASILEGPDDGGAAVADAVTELIDAMLTTFRWVRRGQEPERVQVPERQALEPAHVPVRAQAAASEEDAR
ncbi:hypothetical protein KZX45_02615 [Georgenia sp. EYE_87]|uniref:hypothetical protein n=1 Tax=Georgenia sp. EYE_87 TaxID=2853448 RepID=UPI002005379A|nr:hypothetical protein [Georgenia sp. EYE_87]MCK6209433.1 hypothetical protein [Georgenia sp. EYE_87]